MEKLRRLLPAICLALVAGSMVVVIACDKASPTAPPPPDDKVSPAPGGQNLMAGEPEGEPEPGLSPDPTGQPVPVEEALKGGQPKLNVCHQEGNGGYHIINIAQSAVSAHEGHGDWLVTDEACDGIDNDCDGEVDEGGVCGKLVFVSQSLWQGDLGGLAGADSKCQQSAVAAGLSGSFRAWLSDSRTDAASRLAHATVPYRLVDGTVIANDWSDLVDGSLMAPINLTEFGAATGQIWVFTSTRPDGSRAGGQYCNDWTNSTNAFSAFGVGLTFDTGSQWTFQPAGGGYCPHWWPLYCFEQ